MAGRRPVLELLRSGAGAISVLISADLAPSRILGQIRRDATAAGVPIKTVPKAEIDRLAPDIHHQGVVATAHPFRYADFRALIEAGHQALLVLDGVMDPHNVGSLLRSADGAGIGGVVLPQRRAAGVTAAVRRVSAGASEVVPVAQVANLGRALDDLKAAGYWVVGLEPQGEASIWASDFMEPPIALVLGSEDRGLSQPARERCDAFAHIPSTGKLGSLNVAVAGAVAMFELARRRQASDNLPIAPIRRGDGWEHS